MTLAYVFLVGAVLAETIGAVATRFSHGFTRVLPTTVTVLSVLGAYYLLSLALRAGLEIGVAYAIWAASGVVTVALLGALLFGDRLSKTQVGGMALAVGGVLALQLGGAH
ncbi:small multidrug resistance pump [Haloactinospora alba]|uniref:Small multidrug resistance pump n=1 Tax=Haloactinospora alba TaxID=405555 RepID=A0A543NG75_9ACTN|nr:multidrug efflux SMR transporter [Haloactinospora alba]TQN30848.1 small multidrug resistance pump [Haloactinospora alba]